ncbi:MAG: hypothetical protein WAU62_03410, partial [Dehalococcoidales bacterium]
ILVNRSTQESMPMTAMPEGKIVCIGGDGGEFKSIVTNSKFNRKRTRGLWDRVYILPRCSMLTQYH